MADKLRIGITQGDINGIGYEIILKVLSEPGINDLFTPVIYGSSKIAGFYRKQLNMENNGLSLNVINFADEANPKRSNIINVVPDSVKVESGKATEESGKASIIALEAAVKDLGDGKIDALVTCPISKANTYSESHAFPGHTEFLASTFNVPNYIMLMVNELMRVGFVTSHIPLNEVSKTLSKKLIADKIDIIAKSLKYDFGIRTPRIAVLALNPHAGDSGLLGSEEKQIIIPAIEQAKEEGILAFGPYAADGFFASAQYDKFDAVLAMYHDQGMIPFKSITDKGVNFTAGLPHVRTSPAHGTAFDIAGQGIASEASLREAIFQACDIFRCRCIEDEIRSNPLKRRGNQTYEK